MKDHSFVKRLLRRCAFVFPFMGNVATVYGLYVGFTQNNQSEISQVVFTGSWATLVSLMLLIVGSCFVVALYTFVRAETI